MGSTSSSVCLLLSSVSATSVMESGRKVPEAAKKVTLTPPFALDCQLMANATTPSDLFDERNRLQKTFQDEVLESMHKQLWYAGRKGNISPLHHQKVIRRDIILTERARLHLVWSDKTIYVKRLDDELLDWGYFSTVVCGEETVYQAASGFLLSYAHLIEYPSDLEIAKTHGLVNRDVDWKKWQTFRTSVLYHLTDRDIYDRYEYGELRLGRLNQIYRVKFLGLSYFNVHREYSSYFGDNYMTFVALFALVSVALSAMQVMTSVDGAPAAVSVTSYRFAIATLIALAGSCAGLLVLYVTLYVWNWLLIFFRRHLRQRRR
ncbi:hypothetical protein KCU78_g1227, partial [Aureobasidium melanogenum]